jgi:hypothetical protein
MTTQVKRNILFLIGNIAISTAYIAIVASRATQDSLWNPGNAAWWARVILIYVPVQILFRILSMIVLAAHNAATGEPEEVDREDELDKAIDLKSTSITSCVFMFFFLAALATQAIGLPPHWLYAILAAGLVTSGIIGDAVNLAGYCSRY